MLVGGPRLQQYEYLIVDKTSPCLVWTMVALGLWLTSWVPWW